MTQAQAAKLYGVHPNSVNTLVKAVRAVPQSPLSTEWRSDFEKLTPKSVHVITRTLDDEETPLIQRAGIAQKHLSGVGLYQPEATPSAVFVALVSQLPADWAGEFVTTSDAPVVDVSARDIRSTSEIVDANDTVSTSGLVDEREGRGESE